MVEVPEEMAGRQMMDEFTGKIHTIERALPVEGLLAHFPLALLTEPKGD
jgi:hypothetical protein